LHPRNVYGDREGHPLVAHDAEAYPAAPRLGEGTGASSLKLMKTIYNSGYRRLMGKLRQAREQEGLLLTELASKVGRNRSWLHRIETSQVRLDVLQFARLCRVLNLSPSALLEVLEESSSDDDSFFSHWPLTHIG